jgi:hypothetical protein
VQKRYTNRPIVELEIASQEQMKITEIRLAKLFTSKKAISSDKNSTVAARNAEGTFIYFVICFIFDYFENTFSNLDPIPKNSFVF